MLKRYALLVSLSPLTLTCSPIQPQDPMAIRIRRPLTSPLAKPEQDAKKRTELVNSSCSIHSKPLKIGFQDDQANHKQAAAVAQRLIANFQALFDRELRKTRSNFITKTLEEQDHQVVLQEFSLPDEKDFRPSISKAKPKKENCVGMRLIMKEETLNTYLAEQKRKSVNIKTQKRII